MKSHTKRLADTFNIDVGTYANHGHRNRFCAKCFAATGHQKTRGSTPSFSAVTWSPQSNACSICVEMATRSKRGRPPKAKKRKGGRPSSVVNIDNIMEIDPSKPLSDKHEQSLVFLLSIKASQSTGLQKLIEGKNWGSTANDVCPSNRCEKTIR